MLVALAGLALWITPAREPVPQPAAASAPSSASAAAQSVPELPAEPAPPVAQTSRAFAPVVGLSPGAAGAKATPRVGLDTLSAISRAEADRKAPAKPSGPRSIRGVRKLYVERMANRLDTYIVEEIRKQMPGRLEAVADRDDADAVMTGRSVKHGGSRFTAGFRDDYTGTVSVTGLDGENLLWESEAGDRKVVLGIVKHGGPKKVAERLVGSLKKAMEAKK